MHQLVDYFLILSFLMLLFIILEKLPQNFSIKVNLIFEVEAAVASNLAGGQGVEFALALRRGSLSFMRKSSLI